MEEVWNFISEPTLHPMKVKINKQSKDLALGYIFVSPYTSYEAQMIGQTGSLMMDDEGNPIWFYPLSSRYIQNTDFRVQTYKNKPVLTMWEGTISGTFPNPNLPVGDPEPGAYFRIIDQHYNLIKKIYAQKGYTSDVHEFTITKNNTILFLGVKQIKADLTKYGGPADGYIDDYSIQEVDIETNELLFYWNVLDHVDPTDSMISASSATSSNNIWDCFHVNSVEQKDGTILVSMRNMWTIYEIDKKTKKIIWQLGGKKTDFSFGSNAEFSWQHHARYKPGNRISLFDDACCASSTSPPQGQSRGLILNLDFKNMLVTVDKAFYHDPALFVETQGSLQKLTNGNYLVGWGQEPYVSEFANNGNTAENPSKNFLYDMQFPGNNISYRAFKNKWIGKPLTDPSIAIRKVEAKQNHYIIYVSWNGSTETKAWQVLSGSTSKKLSIIKISKRRGFETKINVKSKYRYFQVKALNSCGDIIGMSDIVKVI